MEILKAEKSWKGWRLRDPLEVCHFHQELDRRGHSLNTCSQWQEAFEESMETTDAVRMDQRAIDDSLWRANDEREMAIAAVGNEISETAHV